MVPLDTSTAQVKDKGYLSVRYFTSKMFLVNCTLGEWEDWSCKMSSGSCGNGTYYRKKTVLTPERNGGGCMNDAEPGQSCFINCTLPSSDTNSSNSSTGTFIVKPWSKSESKPLSKQAPKLNKSPQKKEKRRIWTEGLVWDHYTAICSNLGTKSV